LEQPTIIEEPSTPQESGHETLAEEEISDYHEEEALAEVHICSNTAVELLATQIQGILSAAGADHHFTNNKEIKPDHYRSILRRASRFFGYSLLKMDWYSTGDILPRTRYCSSFMTTIITFLIIAPKCWLRE
jgi:hypothetical protein